jgi:hypothetical protein
VKEKVMKIKGLLAFGLILMMVFGLSPAGATAATEETTRTYYSRPVAFGGGAVKTYVTVDRNKVPVALGIEIPSRAFTNLPQVMAGLILQFPNEARSVPFQYLSFDWNPQGHEPEKVYTRPHFDFHFYLQSPEETKAIKPGPCHGLDCGAYRRAMKDVPAQYMPANHKNVGAVVPMMGNHLIDPAAPEYNNQPFTRTFFYGSYDGKIIFLEPMLTLEYLQSRPNEYLDIKLPAAYAQTGYYPTRYSVRYDAAADVYRIALERFVYHEAR